MLQKSEKWIILKKHYFWNFSISVIWLVNTEKSNMDLFVLPLTMISQRSFFFQATSQQDSQKLDNFFKVKITLTPVHNIFLFFKIFFSSGAKFLIWNLLIEKNWEQKNTLISSNIFSVWNFMWWCHFYFTVKRKLHINWCFVCKLLCASCQNTTFKIKHMAITKSL